MGFISGTPEVNIVGNDSKFAPDIAIKVGYMDIGEPLSSSLHRIISQNTNPGD